MDIKQLTLEDVVSSEVHSQHTTFDFDTQDGEREIRIHFDLEKWNNSLNNNEMINEKFDYYDTDIFGEAVQRFENLDYESHTINGTIIVKDKDSTFTRQDLIEYLVEINKEIQNVIDEKLGKNLEIFLKEKEEEAENELEIDFENSIRTKFYNYLTEHHDKLEANVFISSNKMFSTYDTRRKDPHSSFDNRMQFSKHEKDREEQINRVENLAIVEAVYSTGKDYYKKVELTDTAEQYVNALKQKMTEEFYSAPEFKQPDIAKSFISKNSNGKGQIVDCWLTKDNQVLIQEKNIQTIIKRSELSNEDILHKKIIEQINNTKKTSKLKNI